MNGWQRQIEHPTIGRFRRRAAVGVLVVATAIAALLFPPSAAAQDVEVLLPHKEAQVKFALLYSFSLMITWPDSAFGDEKSPFVIGVLGDRPNLHYLDRVAETKKEIRGHPIVIERYQTEAEMHDCHLLFIAGNAPPSVESAALARPTKRAMLVVAERSLETDPPRSHIQFVIENQVVKFHLDFEAAKDRQLQVDPRLLKLARVMPAARQP
jgi:hypothetical protein